MSLADGKAHPCGSVDGLCCAGKGLVVKLSKVLLVEDNPDLRYLFAYVLSAEGYEVITAEDGLIGLGIAEAEQPDLIITDITMPRLDGIGMIEQLREQPALSSVPILALTAYRDGSVKRALEAGASRVQAKPLAPDVLLSEVKDLLGA